MQIELVLVPQRHIYQILADPNLVRFRHYDHGLAHFILWMKQLRNLSFWWSIVKEGREKYLCFSLNYFLNFFLILKSNEYIRKLVIELLKLRPMLICFRKKPFILNVDKEK